MVVMASSTAMAGRCARSLRAKTNTITLTSAINEYNIISDNHNSSSSRMYVTRTASVSNVGMKPGTTLEGLNFMKNVDEVVSKERSEYPEWLNAISNPQISLAALRKMPLEDASDAEMMRYLKLTRRIDIKRKNLEASVK